MYQSYFACLISHLSKSGDGTLDMLALQWWEDQVSCQQSIVGQPAGLRLPSEVSSRSEEASNPHEWRLSQYMSTYFRVICFHAEHCVWLKRQQWGVLYRLFLTCCSIEGCYIVCYSYACNGPHNCVYSCGRLVFSSSAVVVVFVSSLSPSAMSLLSLLLTHVISYSRMCLGLTQSSCCMAVSRM